MQRPTHAFWLEAGDKGVVDREGAIECVTASGSATDARNKVRVWTAKGQGSDVEKMSAAVATLLPSSSNAASGCAFLP